MSGFKNRKTDKPKSKFSQACSNHIYVFLAFLCSAVLMLLVYYCYDIIPFGNKTVLRMDLFHQYGPLFAELYDRLIKFKSMIYSWNTGGGGSFIGNYFNYLSSPLGNLVALIAGHRNMPEAIGVMVLLKNALAASALAYYLKKNSGRNDFSISAFGILYAFCGFFIAYYWNIMWIDAMVLLPLTVLGIEQIISHRKCRLYVITLALTFLSNYYMAYMVCIFAVLYFLVYYISGFSFKDKYDDMPVYIDDDGTLYSRGIHKLAYNKFLRSGVLFAGSSLAAVCLAAFALIPTYFCLKSCSATSGVFPTESYYYNSIFDFLANHLASVEPTIRSSGDTVLPNVYCGILTVMLVPLYIFCDKIKAKERAAHIVLLAFFFVCFNLNYANYIMHAFHFPNDLPFRFSFIYSFTLIIMAYKALIHIKDIPLKGILGSGLGVIILTILVQKNGMSNVTDSSVYISIGFVAVYSIVLGLMRKKEYAQSAVALLLMCCVFAEAALSDIDRFQITQVKDNFTNGYNDFRKLKEKIDSDEGTDMYRMELTDINTLMDASWFNYNGISVFSSMAYEASANLQHQLGLDSNYINSYVYHSQTPVYNCMMSLKYLVSNDNTRLNESLFSFKAQCGKFTAYTNNYYLPIGYCVGKDMVKLDTESPNPFDIQSNFWHYATGGSNIFNKLYADDYLLDNIEDGAADFTSDTFSFFKENIDAEGQITLYYDIPESSNIYMFFSCSEIDSINVFTSRGMNTVQSTNDPYVLDCGYCKTGDRLTVEIPVDTESGYVECYVVSLNQEELDKGYKTLADSALDVSEFEETYIKGTVTADKDQMLYTSINYDEGWTVTVDGEVAEKVKIGDALIGINLSEGEHTIEFKYSPRGLKLGLIISGATGGALLIYLLIETILKKKKREETEENVQSDEQPTGIEAMMEEDLGRNATVEDAEALLEPKDDPEPDDPKPDDPAPTINRADEILKTQKLNLKLILKAQQDENQQENKDE